MIEEINTIASMDIGTMVTEIPKMYSNWINSIAGGNEFLAGTLGVAALGGIAYLCRSVPGAIFEGIQRRTIVTMTVDSADYGFRELLTILRKKQTDLGSRNFKMVEDWERSAQYSQSFAPYSGIGKHYFIWNRRLYWYEIADLDSAGVNAQKQRITLCTFGLTVDPIIKLLRTLEIPRLNSNISFYSNNGRGNQTYIGCMEPQGLDDICLDEDVRTHLKEILDTFKNNKEETRRLGIPDKLVIVLHGEPGNGKSKLIPAIARYLQMNINNINVNGIDTAEGFMQSISDSRELHVLEDIHSMAGLKKQNTGVQYQSKDDGDSKESSQVVESKPVVIPKKRGDTVSSDGSSIEAFTSIKLSEFLNTLNGAVPLNGQVIIMTTNYIDDLDQAILRPGRTDHVIRLPRIKPETANAWLENVVPGFKAENGFKKPIRGCDIGGLLQITRGNVDKLNAAIPKVEAKIPEPQTFEFNDANNTEFD